MTDKTERDALVARLRMHARDCVSAADMDTDTVLSAAQIDDMADALNEAAAALAPPAASVDVERLRERAERLEAALRPFAALYQADALCAHSDDQPDSRGVYGINAANITLGDLRRARAALADGEAASA